MRGRISLMIWMRRIMLAACRGFYGGEGIASERLDRAKPRPRDQHRAKTWKRNAMGLPSAQEDTPGCARLPRERGEERWGASASRKSASHNLQLYLYPEKRIVMLR